MARLELQVSGCDRLLCICDVLVDLGSWSPPCLDGLLHVRQRGRSHLFGLLLCCSLRRSVCNLVSFAVTAARKPCQDYSTTFLFDSLGLSFDLCDDRQHPIARTVCSWPFREVLVRKVQGLAPVIYFFSKGIIRVQCFRSNLPLTVVASMMSIWLVGTSSFLP